MLKEHIEDQLKRTSNDGIAVHARERNQLKNESIVEFAYWHARCEVEPRIRHSPFLSELPDKVSEIILCEASVQPVEARAEIVHHPFLLTSLFSYFLGKRTRQFQIRCRSLEPKQVSIGCVLECAGDGGGQTRL